MTQSNSFFDRLNQWIRNSITIKLVSVGILMLILLFPTSMVESLISEREYYRQGVISEISSIWGNDQTITGPILTVPYRTYFRDQNDKLVSQIDYAHFLPDHLEVEGNIDPEKRYRGICEAIVYTTDLNLKGTFPRVEMEEWVSAQEDILWQDAYLALGITDMRGIKNQVSLSWNGQPITFDPGTISKDVVSEGISAATPLQPIDSGGYRFQMDLALNGSSSLNFVPVGKTTNVDIKSNWPHPSFSGAFLPEDRQISSDQFQAQWEVLHLNRNFPQQWSGANENVMSAIFGVDLFIPVDQYQKSTRAAKYAILFIGLTFLIFFFVEAIYKKRIHPFQYILVGLALIVFYTVLIALSEHIAFNLAYLLAGVAIVVMVTLYARTLFPSWRHAGLIGLILVLLYTFLFITLQLQDYALLMGSIGLLLILGLVMYWSRKIEWYQT
ncbi:MAG: cell envelope integrity protein CreD [Cyclobacteriaceae bacterium]